MNEPTYLEKVQAAASKFKGNPLYILSTSAQELFHSNMLYWLISTQPDASRALVQTLGWSGGSAPKCRREQYHFDLLLTGAGDDAPVVVENKLAAVPDKKQLDQYAKAAAAQLSGAKPQYVLLSLIPPPFEPGQWRRVDYEALLAPLEEAHATMDNTWEAELVGEYAKLVRRLVELRSVVCSADVGDPWLLSSNKTKEVHKDRLLPPEMDLREELEEERLLPLVEKLKVVVMARRLSQKASFADLEFETNWSRSQPSLSYFGPPLVPEGAKSPRHQLGWQLQGSQFRLAVATRGDTKLLGSSEKKRQARVAYAEEYYADHFSFDKLPSEIALTEPKKPEQFRHFSPDFVYRYRNVAKDITWGQVEKLLVWATEHVTTESEARVSKTR